jgi:DNA-directed RNA polymerase subunit L
LIVVSRLNQKVEINIIVDKKTLVFDMDETLIHTSEVMTAGYEIKVPFKAFQGKISNGYVNVRPYAK